MSLDPAFDRFPRLNRHMNIEISAHEAHHLFGESATHPIEQCYGLLAALLRQSQEALAFVRHKQSSRTVCVRTQPCGHEAVAPALTWAGRSAGGQQAVRTPCHTLAITPNHSPIGRVQLLDLG